MHERGVVVQNVLAAQDRLRCARGAAHGQFHPLTREWLFVSGRVPDQQNIAHAEPLRGPRETGRPFRRVSVRCIGSQYGPERRIRIEPL
jgi:hypothetical protein